MEQELRRAPRRMVSGLVLTIDGRAHDILDLSTTGVQVLIEPDGADPVPRVQVEIRSESDAPGLLFRCAADLVRESAHSRSYRFEAPLDDDLDRFSIFNTLPCPFELD